MGKVADCVFFGCEDEIIQCWLLSLSVICWPLNMLVVVPDHFKELILSTAPCSGRCMSFWDFHLFSSSVEDASFLLSSLSLG